MKIHILPTPYSVTTDPEKTADNMRQVGDKLRKSKAIGNPEEKPKYSTQITWWPDWFNSDDEKKPDTATLADGKKDGKDAEKSKAPAVADKKK